MQLSGSDHHGQPPSLDPQAVWAQHLADRAQERLQSAGRGTQPAGSGGDKARQTLGESEPDMAYAEPSFSNASDDDLPRTLLRERDARRGHALSAAAAGTGYGEAQGLDSAPDTAGPAVTVRAFDVPFMKMVTFFLKAVFAAIPALLLLTVILYGFGQALQKFLPWLVKMRIIISFP